MFARNTIIAVCLAMGGSGIWCGSSPALAEDFEPLERVETWQHILGPPVAFYVGFGSGQAVQGRWSEMGSTIAGFELGGLGLTFLGLLNCLGSYGKDQWEQDLACSPMYVGAVMFFGTRLYRVYDTIAMPFAINAKIEHERRRRKSRRRASLWPEVRPHVRRGAEGVSPQVLLTWRW